MSNTEALRTAAQQALEALERSLYPQTKQKNTIAALRAALAEPDVPETDFGNMAAAVAEPVASVTECEACFTPDVCQLRGTCDHYAAERLRVAAPPQREPLTDEQLWQSDEIMSLNADFGWPMETIVMFCRVIEAAHGIKAKEAP